jgi:formiminoglutamate deiminase
MGAAVLAAAAAAGIRLTLLDTCYLEAGPGRPAGGVQLRFSDGDADRWAKRADALLPLVAQGERARPAAAIHSVRAVPPDAARVVAGWAAGQLLPLHFHLSEQPAENELALDTYSRTPTAILADAGALGPRSVAVHATHLTLRDQELLAGTGTGVCMCPTTERDLADGIGPAARLHGLGSPLSLGSDSHAVIDPFEEMRALELDERLRTGERGHWTASELLHAATAAGHAAIGWSDTGRIAPGALADLVTVRLDSPRLAGLDDSCLLEGIVFAATAADVATVVIAGQVVVEDGQHCLIENVPEALHTAILAVTRP